MDVYVNSRASDVRIVQYVIAGATLLLVFVGYSEGLPEIAPVAAIVGAICLVAFEFFYIRTNVTRISQEATGWVMRTLSTFGERIVRFETWQARLGPISQKPTLYGQIFFYYPFTVAGRTYTLDATPPMQIDAEALRRHFGA